MTQVPVTLLNYTLSNQQGLRSAVLVNDFGEVGIMEVNRLFTARSGCQFCVELTGGGIDSHMHDLEGKRQRRQEVPQRRVIGNGAGMHYILYDPCSDKVEFCTAGRSIQSKAQGFQ